MPEFLSLHDRDFCHYSDAVIANMHAPKMYLIQHMHPFHHSTIPPFHHSTIPIPLNPDTCTHHCHSWQLQGNIYIANFGHSWQLHGKSQIWKHLHCHLWPFLATPWKEPDLETKHYCHFWAFLGTHHCHSWQIQNEPDLETVTLPLLALPGNSGMSQIWKQNIIATFGISWAHILPFLATLKRTRFGNITLLPLLAIHLAIPGNSRISRHTSCHFWSIVSC